LSISGNTRPSHLMIFLSPELFLPKISAFSFFHPFKKIHQVYNRNKSLWVLKKEQPGINSHKRVHLLNFHTKKKNIYIFFFSFFLFLLEVSIFNNDINLHALYFFFLSFYFFFYPSIQRNIVRSLWKFPPILNFLIMQTLCKFSSRTLEIFLFETILTVIDCYNLL
jgi:hypothetical protein